MTNPTDWSAYPERPLRAAPVIDIARLATEPEPTPVGGGREVYPALIRSLDSTIDGDLITALIARDRMGRRKYSTPLTTNNGRRAMVDALQEVQDLLAYLEQATMEGDLSAETTMARYHTRACARKILRRIRAQHDGEVSP